MLVLATCLWITLSQEDGYNVSGDQTSWVNSTTERSATNEVNLLSFCSEANVDWSSFTWYVLGSLLIPDMYIIYQMI